MSTQSKPYITPEQYLEIERKAEYKSEYYRGEMFAMAGAGRPHNLLVGHLVRDLGIELRAKPCEVYPSDMRVQAGPTGLYTYPDVVVVCGEPHLLDNQFDTLLNPTLLIEVLSPSTELYDRGQKFEKYKTISSLRQYLMVSSDRVHADLYTRHANGGWLLTSAEDLEDSIDLQSIGCSLNLASIYERIDFTAPRG